MVSEPLRVGLVGANPKRGWAMLSHLPAINLLPDLKLTAVSTTNMDSARAAGMAFGVDEYYDSAEKLAQSANVDIVSVSVKVPYHAGIVRAALKARKHVMCEWPLALSVEEAEVLCREGAEAGVHCGVGLQGRMSPAARRARNVIASGAIGRPLTVSVFASTIGFGALLPASNAYLNELANGASMPTILGGHTLDLVIYVLGGLAEVQAMTATKYREVKFTDQEGFVERNTPDYVSIQGRFENGAMLSAEIEGGRPADTPFHVRVVGTQGTLTLHGGHPYGFQAGELTLECSVPLEAPEAPAAPGLAGTTANVGELYSRFARDIRTGEHETADFAQAARLHRLIRSIGSASASGVRQQPDGWPS